jgi:predicted TIM-barrel fold metal-dependent hydrolase
MAGPVVRGDLVDLHVHFMPDRVMHKVWAVFDRAEQEYGRAWPIRYRLSEPQRVAALRAHGVSSFAPLVYAHRPGMARWLNDWVHCGDGPRPGVHTGLGIFAEVLRRHPRLTAVLAHAGLPDYAGALDLVHRFPRVHLDTTMVGTAFTEEFAPLPPDWAARLADVADRVALGSDFPSIPYPYGDQIRAIEAWARADDRLGEAFLDAVLRDTPRRLLGL